MNNTKQTIPKATAKLKYISFYHALALLYGDKEEYFYNFLKNQHQSIENIRSAVALHVLPKKSKQNSKPTYDYTPKELEEKIIPNEILKEQNRTYNKFDNLYSEFPQAVEQPSKKIIDNQQFLKWAVKFGYINNPFIKPAFNKNVENILFEVLSKCELISKIPKTLPWQWIGKRNQLPYFAKYLKTKRKLGDNCHSELSVYIADSKPNSKKPLKNIIDISDKSKNFIEDVADEFIAKISK